MNKESAIAIVRIVLPCVVSVLGVLGITTVGGIDLAANQGAIVSVAVALVGGIASIYTGWKNNNVTQAAQAAQAVLDAAKAAE